MKFIVSSLLLLSPFVFAVEEGGRRISSSQIKQNPTYLKKRTQLEFIQSRIKVVKSEIKKLMLKKKTTQDPKKNHKIITQLVKLHANLNKEIKKYNHLKQQLKYRYPGKGYEYITLREPSLSQTEDEIELEAKLTQLKKKVDKKYESFVDKDKLRSKKARNKTQKHLAQGQARRPATLQKKKKRLRLEK